MSNQQAHNSAMFKRLISALGVLAALNGAVANALEAGSQAPALDTAQVSYERSISIEANNSSLPGAVSGLRSAVIKPLPPQSRYYAQNQSRNSKKNIRSRSEVVQEVKRKYDAEVLKISLNKQGSAYRVRILMPNGRVREITVSASR